MKEFYVTIQGAKVIVKEEVYRAYIQPFWKEKKRRQRQTADGSIPLSLDQILEDSKSGFDIAGDVDVEAEVARKLDNEEIILVIQMFLGSTILSYFVSYMLSNPSGISARVIMGIDYCDYARKLLNITTCDLSIAIKM